ncbi:Crp/Fnr family transcriptional regulator [Nocardioides sp. zg-DK7169]|uniref:Crp/Fnr family transcriptional regulator n=1 Tax=Nocardioides sp. zg-DK7169 TaxID=2736600 RepID=UPI00155582D9|nr:cyclic nucleotide-binding domain-containing protein [Nocardioides sp. zg-DK7169]NPC98119.1 cyclic nucleotide-binding domain-containing protein [Nocardioides sp. zg-DK7169]
MTATFFDAFSPQEVARISAAGTHLTLPAGWSPIWEQTPADKAYILLSGTVSIRRHGQEIARLGSGDIVGESAIVGRQLRTATVVALTPLELIHLTTEAVQRLREEMPRFRDAIDAVAAARLR